MKKLFLVLLSGMLLMGCESDNTASKEYYAKVYNLCEPVRASELRLVKNIHEYLDALMDEDGYYDAQLLNEIRDSNVVILQMIETATPAIEQLVQPENETDLKESALKLLSYQQEFHSAGVTEIIGIVLDGHLADDEKETGQAFLLKLDNVQRVFATHVDKRKAFCEDAGIDEDEKKALEGR